MSAKSIHEADGKALLAFFLSKSPVYAEAEPALSFDLGPPKVVPLYFKDEASFDAVIAKAERANPWLLEEGAKFVVKPDQLIKRRGKSGLLGLNKSWEDGKDWIKQRAAKPVVVEGITGTLRHFLVEPFVPHDQKNEYYVNINSAREGDWILFYHEGGVDVGDVDSKASKLLIPVDIEEEYPSNESIKKALFSKVPEDQHATLLDFINRLYAVYVDLQFTYLEINPLVVIPNPTGVEVYYLDLAAKLDQTAEFECGFKWAEARSSKALGTVEDESEGKTINVDAGPPMTFPAPFGRELSKEEKYIADLDAKTGASLKLTVLNSHGRIWTLVAGGGASVVYADAIASAGYAEELANYGEYSGAPSEVQTFEYAKTVLDLMTRGPPNPKGKILFIGGGIANFTSVGATFKGIIRAFREYSPKLHSHDVKIFVRRGGPNWQEGLQLLKNAGEELELDMEIYGPDMHVSGIVPLALKGKKFNIAPFGISTTATSALPSGAVTPSF